MTLIEWIVSAFVLVGGIFSVVAAIGIHRLPDVYSRIHAAGKSSTFGVMSIAIGVFLYFAIDHQVFAGKVLLAIPFVFLTAPMAGLVIGRTAYFLKVPLCKDSVCDDMSFCEEKGQSKGH